MLGLAETCHLSLRRGGLRRCISSCTRWRGQAESQQSTVPLPDFNTDVNVHQHRLKRPVLKGSWQGLAGLQERVKGSLIPQTLQEMEKDKEFQITKANLQNLGQAQLTREERKRRQRALDHLQVPAFRQVKSPAVHLLCVVSNKNSEEHQTASASTEVRRKTHCKNK